MNMDAKAALGIAAGVISISGFIPYIASILKKKTKPNRATWWIWTLVGGVLFAGYVASGNWSSAWVPLSYVLGPLLVSLLALRHGEGGWEPFDRKCLLSSFIGLLLWGILGTPLLAMIINIGVDLAGALPTMRKTYKNPESENKTAWVLFFMGTAINCLAVRSWSEPSAILPLYFCAMTAIMMALCFRRIPARGSLL